MTATTWTPTDCPKCRASATVELDTDARLCLECRYEWAPSTTTAPFPVSMEEQARAQVPVARAPLDIADVREAPAHIAAARSRYLGAGVVLPTLSVSGTVTEITGEGFAVVDIADGFDVMVLPDEFTVTEPATVSDETITALATTEMTVAALILRAGAATVVQRGDVFTLGMAPDAWLPDEPGIMPVVEHGAAYAIAILATTAGISTDDLLALASRLDDAAEAAEGTDDAGN